MQEYTLMTKLIKVTVSFFLLNEFYSSFDNCNNSERTCFRDLAVHIHYKIQTVVINQTKDTCMQLHSQNTDSIFNESS